MPPAANGIDEENARARFWLSRDGSHLDEKWNVGGFQSPALCPVKSSKRPEVHMSREFLRVAAASLLLLTVGVSSAQTPARDKPRCSRSVTARPRRSPWSWSPSP